jgi:hypothetical protein
VQVPKYFDAYFIGFTARPSKQTFGFFHQNLLMGHNDEIAVLTALRFRQEQGWARFRAPQSDERQG